MKLTFDNSMQGCNSVLLCCLLEKQTLRTTVGIPGYDIHFWKCSPIIFYLHVTDTINRIYVTSLFKGKMYFASIIPFMFVPFLWSVVSIAASPYFNGKNLTRKDPLYLMWINSFYEEYLYQLKNKPQLQNISVNILNENRKDKYCNSANFIHFKINARSLGIIHMSLKILGQQTALNT